MEKEISMNEANAMQEALNNATDFYIAKSCLIDSSVIASAFNLNPEQLANFAGMRIYFGLKYHESVDQAANNNGTKTIVPIMVAVDSQGNDILGNVDGNQKDGSLVFDYVVPCPKYCPTNNELSASAQLLVIHNAI